MVRPSPIRQLRLPHIRHPCQPVRLRLVHKRLSLLQARRVLALAAYHLLNMLPRKHARPRHVAVRNTDLEGVVVCSCYPHVLYSLVLQVLDDGPARAKSPGRVAYQQLAGANDAVELLDLGPALVALAGVFFGEHADHAVALETKHL